MHIVIDSIEVSESRQQLAIHTISWLDKASNQIPDVFKPQALNTLKSLRAYASSIGDTGKKNTTAVWRDVYINWGVFSSAQIFMSFYLIITLVYSIYDKKTEKNWFLSEVRLR
jgi:hypothetical protein